MNLEKLRQGLEAQYTKDNQLTLVSKKHNERSFSNLNRSNSTDPKGYLIEKQRRMKDLERTINQEQGVTFQPKINSNFHVDSDVIARNQEHIQRLNEKMKILSSFDDYECTFKPIINRPPKRNKPVTSGSKDSKGSKENVNINHGEDDRTPSRECFCGEEAGFRLHEYHKYYQQRKQMLKDSFVTNYPFKPELNKNTEQILENRRRLLENLKSNFPPAFNDYDNNNDKYNDNALQGNENNCYLPIYAQNTAFTGSETNNYIKNNHQLSQQPSMQNNDAVLMTADYYLNNLHEDQLLPDPSKVSSIKRSTFETSNDKQNLNQALNRNEQSKAKFTGKTQENNTIEEDNKENSPPDEDHGVNKTNNKPKTSNYRAETNNNFSTFNAHASVHSNNAASHYNESMGVSNKVNSLQSLNNTDEVPIIDSYNSPNHKNNSEVYSNKITFNNNENLSPTFNNSSVKQAQNTNKPSDNQQQLNTGKHSNKSKKTPKAVSSTTSNSEFPAIRKNPKVAKSMGLFSHNNKLNIHSTSKHQQTPKSPTSSQLPVAIVGSKPLSNNMDLNNISDSIPKSLQGKISKLYYLILYIF